MTPMRPAVEWPGCCLVLNAKSLELSPGDRVPITQLNCWLVLSTVLLSMMYVKTSLGELKKLKAFCLQILKQK